MRAALDGDGLVDDVTLDARGGCQADLEAAHTSDDAAIDHNVVCDHFTAHGSTFTDGQQMGANVAVYLAFDLNVASCLQVSGDQKIGRQHGCGWLGFWCGCLEVRGRRRWLCRGCCLGFIGLWAWLVDFGFRKHLVQLLCKSLR